MLKSLEFKRFVYFLLASPPQPQQSIPQKDYKELLKKHLSTYGKPLSPVIHRDSSKAVPDHVKCPLCNAPHGFIYYNDGKKCPSLDARSVNTSALYPSTGLLLYL